MSEYQTMNYADAFKPIGKKVNFENGWVHAHPVEEEHYREGTYKCTLYVEERSNLTPLWAEVRKWLGKQNAEFTILIGKYKRGGTQPYCLAWEKGQ